MENAKEMKTLILILFFTGMLLVSFRQSPSGKAEGRRPPNILFAIADDQSYPHASAYGQAAFRTPAFDGVAARGILFTNAFVAAPQCSPSRAAILTGRPIWQLEEAGTHSSYFPRKFPVFTDALENAGYFIGYTGKPWGPGNYQDAGWSRNPVGPAYNQRNFTSVPAKGISKTDYAGNFEEFLAEKPADKPFFFWYGGQEPHRSYEEGSGLAGGLSPEDLTVPRFLPATDLVKSDLLDYALEIGWFDAQLGKMLERLEAAGELENTVVVVTADNGMAFPYAKANLQEFGTHVPLAIAGPGIKGKNRKVDDLVSLIDLAPTLLDLAGVNQFSGIVGKTLLPVFASSKSGVIDASRQFVLTGRERHTHARPDNVGYPARAIRTKEYLYIRNFKPERWPMGDPAPDQPVVDKGGAGGKPIVEGFEDVDDSPTKSYMISNRAGEAALFNLSFAKRESDELYRITTDPFCLQNLAGSSQFKTVRERLKKQLLESLSTQKDPRVVGNGDVFDSYPRFGPMRPFSGFREKGKYNPEFIKK